MKKEGFFVFNLGIHLGLMLRCKNEENLRKNEENLRENGQFCQIEKILFLKFSRFLVLI